MAGAITAAPIPIAREVPKPFGNKGLPSSVGGARALNQYDCDVKPQSPRAGAFLCGSHRCMTTKSNGWFAMRLMRGSLRRIELLRTIGSPGALLTFVSGSKRRDRGPNPTMRNDD
jgi:hypothetical protein